MSNRKKKVIVIGAGIGGLATAARLAKEGYSVEVFEKNSVPGGRAGILEEEGFRFDTGPSWFMMPEVFEKYFNDFDLQLHKVLTLTPLNPQYRVFFDDRTTFDIPAGTKQVAKLFETIEKGSAKPFMKYMKDSKEKYDIAMNTILYKNADNILDLINRDLLQKSRQILGLFEPMNMHVSRYFSNQKIQQILEYNLVFLGCSPDNAPSLFSMMAYADFERGVWYPKGGMYEIVRVLQSLGEKFGARYHYNQNVTKIITKQKKALGVISNGKKFTGDIVISNSDYKYTEDIIDNQDKRSYPPTYWKNKTMTPSAFLMYLGVKGKLPEIKHHTLYFGSDWREHFKDIFDTPRWPENPSLYINKSSATDKSVAPKGHENLMILVPIASGLSETPIKKNEYANKIIRFIEKKMGLTFTDKIVYQSVFSISDFEARYNSYRGNALGGLAHTLFQSSIWRPTNKSKKLTNLYFAGANTVPGIGVPPAIISSHLVYDRIQKDES